MSLAPYLALQNAVQAMLAEAQAGEWDNFVERQSQYRQLSSQLPPIDWHAYGHDEQAQLVLCLKQTRNMLDETVPLAEAWRNELAVMLSSVHNASKLDKAYRP